MGGLHESAVAIGIDAVGAVQAIGIHAKSGSAAAENLKVGHELVCVSDPVARRLSESRGIGECAGHALIGIDKPVGVHVDTGILQIEAVGRTGGKSIVLLIKLRVGNDVAVAQRLLVEAAQDISGNDGADNSVLGYSASCAAAGGAPLHQPCRRILSRRSIRIYYHIFESVECRIVGWSSGAAAQQLYAGYSRVAAVFQGNLLPVIPLGVDER